MSSHQTPASIRRRRTDETGRRGETLAALILTAKGYAIAGRRERTGLGELDVIAVKGRLIAFVEVKWRPDLATALEAVSAAQRRRIEASARLWQARHPRYREFTVRFDVFALSPNLRWRHVRDAWREGD